MGVREGYRRRHLARRLYSELEKRMAREGVRIMIVDTEADNAEALAFLHVMGFTASSRRVPQCPRKSLWA